MSKKTTKSRMDFLPNRANRYAIRRFTVGTASILIGATLVLGVHHDAQAAEEDSTSLNSENSDATQSETSSVESPETQTTEQSVEKTQEVPTEEASQEETSTINESAEEVPTEEASTEQSSNASTEEKSTEQPTKTPTEESSPTPSEEPQVDERDSVDSTQNTTEETAKSNEASTENTSVEPPQTNDVPTDQPSTSEPPQNEINLDELDQQQKEDLETYKRSYQETDNKADVFNTILKDNGFSDEQTKDIINQMDLGNLNQLSSEEALNQLIYEALQYAQKNQQPQNFAVLPTATRDAREESVNTAVPLAAEAQGNNVNDKVNFENLAIIDDNGDTTIRPNNGEGFVVRSSFNVDNSVNSGDYFTVKLPNTVVTNDHKHDDTRIDDIKNANGDVIANASYDPQTKTVTYKFTDYVDTHSNVKGSINYYNFIDRNVVRNDTKDVPLNYEFAGEALNEKRDVQYEPYESLNGYTIGTSFTYFDQQTGEYVQTIYVNPESNAINPTTLDIYGVGDSSAVINDQVSYKVFEVPQGETLNKSYFFDENQYKDVTNSDTPQFSNNNMRLNFKAINNPYIVQVRSKADLNSQKPLIQGATLSDGDTRVSMSNQVLYGSGSTDAMGETYKLGNYVWEDTNKNGIQDEAQTGVKDVTVQITLPTGEILTTTTDENGYYEFSGLVDGDYKVEFSNLPEGYEVTTTNATSDPEQDSNGLDSVVTINGQDNMSADLGIYKKEIPKYELGDFVWEDTNKDGIQNNDEPGIAGVKVTLTKPDGTTEETTTDEQGNYRFTGLENGDYTVKFETPEGYEQTVANSGDNDAEDSDGTEVDVTINGANDLTIDSGFHKAEVEPPVEPTYKIGDKVWEDTNKDGLQDADEPGIAGVKVTLTKPDGTTEETTTDENGMYVFEGLKNGDYTVKFEAPEGYEATIENAGNDELDSDGASVKVTVNNADDLTIDSGFHKPEETPPGETPPGETPPGETPPGETPPGETPPGETPPEETPPGETPPGETPPGETPPGETPPGETPPGETPPGETPPRETPPGKTPPGETPPSETPSMETPSHPGQHNERSQKSMKSAYAEANRKGLPETGNVQTQNGTIFGALLAGLGLLLVGRRKKHKSK
ncbi:SdrD B-like domain-containing protein [Staphylococcus felis]